MKILILSPYFPYPAVDGGKVRLFNLIKHLSAANDVFLLSYIESEEMRRHVPAMEQWCRQVRTVVRDERRGIFTGAIPRSAGFYYTPEMIAAVEKAVAEIVPDVVQVDFLVMTPYADHVRGVPLIYTEHDMSSIDFEQSYHDRDLPEKERFVEWGKLVRFEKEILSRYRAVIVLTERDRRILGEFAPECRSTLIPTGVDVEYFRARPSSAHGARPSLLYLGHYRHYPNLDAVQYFAGEILPHIEREVPEVSFTIAGSGVTPSLRALAGPRVTITGTVEDVRPYLSEAAVFVAPVRLGGGIKGKVLEAMAAGVPVVATTEAVSGISCAAGRDVLVADDPREFAAEVVRLLRDPVLRDDIAARARRLVEERYDWRGIAVTLNRFYDGLIRGCRVMKGASGSNRRGSTA